MKTTLTIEQSAELIKRGVSAERASDDYVGRWECYSTGTFADPDSVEPIFTLSDLLSLLPKTIAVPFSFNGRIGTKEYYFCTQWCICGDYANNPQWSVYYTDGFALEGDFDNKELIDAMFDCIIWAIDHNHVKFD